MVLTRSQRFHSFSVGQPHFFLAFSAFLIFVFLFCSDALAFDVNPMCGVSHAVIDWGRVALSQFAWA
jgi:hypothetical protein